MVTSWHTDLSRYLLYWSSSLSAECWCPLRSIPSSGCVTPRFLALSKEGTCLQSSPAELRCARAGLPVFCLKAIQLLNLGQMQPGASSSLQTAAADGMGALPSLKLASGTNQSVAFPHLACLPGTGCGRTLLFITFSGCRCWHSIFHTSL